MAQLEVGEVASADWKLAVQPVPVFMLVRAHPFVRLSYESVFETMQHDIPVGLAWVPVTQSGRLQEANFTLDRKLWHIGKSSSCYHEHGCGHLVNSKRPNT